MSEAILFRNRSKESEKVKKLLKEMEINFVEVFSESKSEKPVLMVDTSAYSFIGYEDINEYLSSFNDSKIKNNSNGFK